MGARRNYKRADNFRQDDFWDYVLAKWIDLANWYRSDEDISIVTHPTCPHCRGVMMLSFVEPAHPAYDRRVFKCIACGHVKDVKVRIDNWPGLGRRMQARWPASVNTYLA
jgi:hypothetical protein